jgi:hypoxanthine phosphoribosyltransferase
MTANSLQANQLGRVLLTAEAIQQRVRELGAQITADYAGKNPVVVAILKGASLFHADLVRAINLPVSFDFMAVGSYGASTKSSGEVRILKDLDQSIEGKEVILVEDILDTGLTLNYLRHNLQNRGPRSIKIAVLLNKPSRRAVEVLADYVGFDIPDDFVIGYGLDFDQKYRNLPEVRVLDETPGK